MKQGLTDITIILDRSGSMQHIAGDTIGGVNKFIQDQRSVPGEALLTLCLFDHEYDRIITAIPVRDVKLLDATSYVPRGNTCLFGAIGASVLFTGERLRALPESERPEHVIVLIVTDGQENSSHQHEWSRLHTQDSVRAAIELQSNIYKWQFVYIGANQNAIVNAVKMGIHPKFAMNYSDNAAGTSALYASSSSNVRGMRSGLKKDMSWEAEQLKLQAEAKS